MCVSVCVCVCVCVCLCVCVCVCVCLSVCVTKETLFPEGWTFLPFVLSTTINTLRDDAWLWACAMSMQGEGVSFAATGDSVDVVGGLC